MQRAQTHLFGFLYCENNLILYYTFRNINLKMSIGRTELMLCILCILFIFLSPFFVSKSSLNNQFFEISINHALYAVA